MVVDARLQYHRTYGLPVVITRCSNNYGPHQFPEKMIPLFISNLLDGQRVPLYGDGMNVRDWLHVADHCRGLVLALEGGEPGGTYLFGGDEERTTVQVVETVCDVLDELRPQGAPHARLVAFVADRPGHDFRYALDTAPTDAALGWRTTTTFGEGIRSTVEWYLEHLDWSERRLGARYALERLGVGRPAGAGR